MSPESLADVAGLQVGHAILSVNGVSCIDRTTEEVMSVLKSGLHVSMVTMPIAILEAIQSSAQRV